MVLSNDHGYLYKLIPVGDTKILPALLHLRPGFSTWWHASANSVPFLSMESWKVALLPFCDGNALGPL